MENENYLSLRGVRARGRVVGARSRGSRARGRGARSTCDAGASPSGAGPTGVSTSLDADRDRRAQNARTQRILKNLDPAVQAELKQRKLLKECSFLRLPVVSGPSRKRTARMLGDPAMMPLAQGVPAELPASLPPPWKRPRLERLSLIASAASTSSATASMSSAPESSSSFPNRHMVHGTPSPVIDLEASTTGETGSASPDLSHGSNSGVPSPSSHMNIDDVVLDVDDENLGLDPASDVEVDDKILDDPSECAVIETREAETVSMLTNFLPPATTNTLITIDRTNDAAVRNFLSNDHLTFNWRNDLLAFQGVWETFTGTPGPTFPLSELNSPVDAFLKFWDDDIMDIIVTETNRYAAQFKEADSNRYSRARRWKDTNKAELYVFFAMQIHQSLTNLPVEKYYFVPPAYVTAMPHFKEVISYDRWVLLKKFLHFSDNSSRPASCFLRSKFKSLYLPEQCIALDESLLKWLGHLSFIQTITTTAAGSGIKTYELCESSSRYLWDFSVYTGKPTKGTENDDGDLNMQQTDAQTDKTTAPPEQLMNIDVLGDTQTGQTNTYPEAPTGATAKIVYDLASPLFHKGHTIVMDNFYNSPLLARCLKLNGMDCYGTLRLNRDSVPDSLKAINKTCLTTGEIIASTSGDINVMTWKDTGLVNMLSTYHKMEVGLTEKYWTYKYKPQVVCDYNKTMGGVDKKDQLLAGFPLERKRNCVWHKKFFRRLLNVSVMNAYIIYKNKDKRINHRDFRTDLANELLDRFHSYRVEPTISRSIPIIRQLPGVARGLPPRPVLENGHYSVDIDANDRKHPNCVWCSTTIKRVRTKLKCDVCNVPLCAKCMKPYHNGTIP